jgi:gluconate 2-dehydrogenase gamma chain
MTSSPATRREFLAQLGAAGMLLQSPLLLSLASCARDAVSRGEPLMTLTDAEGRAFAALAARIIPSGDGPGATEAGAVYFADRALAGPLAGMLEPLRNGLADLDARARSARGEAFADLAADDQDVLIREVQQAEPFFAMAHFLTVAGVFADPSYGGNRGDVGPALLGVEHAPVYAPPFGFYDAEYARQNGGAR